MEDLWFCDHILLVEWTCVVLKIRISLLVNDGQHVHYTLVKCTQLITSICNNMKYIHINKNPHKKQNRLCQKHPQ